MEAINRMRKNRKGFTLVEIIVVLIILAILAAFTIPTMLGFVNDARGKAMIAEARTVYVAAQSTATEYAATTETNDKALGAALSSAAVLNATVPTSGASFQMLKYLGTDLDIKAASGAPEWTVVVGTDLDTVKTGQVKEVSYKKGGYTVTIKGNSATVVKTS